jgi:hypothetical protein
VNFWHRLLNPHCPDCEKERICQSCETLRLQLDIANKEKERLLQSIIQLNKPLEMIQEKLELEPIKSRYTPWAVKREMLEREAKQQNQERTEEIIKKQTEELEKEFGISNG